MLSNTIIIICFVLLTNCAAHSAEDDTPWKGLVSGSEAIVVSGGFELDFFSSNVEIILPKTGQFCSLPSLPYPVFQHTMDGLHVCGGLPEDDAIGDAYWQCLIFSAGNWTTYSSLIGTRAGHSSWQTEEGIFLIGGMDFSGEYSRMDSEYVPNLGDQGEPSFSLKYPVLFSCGIPDISSNSIIITGGYNNQQYSNQVTRYDEEGFVEDLPSLLVGRSNHGCGSFIRSDGNMVLLVSGGDGMDNALSSTEMLVPGAAAWTFGTPLPQARAWIKGVTVDNILYMTGGVKEDDKLTDEILEWRDDEEEWGLGVWMEFPKAGHAASTIKLDEDIMNYCTFFN